MDKALHDVYTTALYNYRCLACLLFFCFFYTYVIVSGTLKTATVYLLSYRILYNCHKLIYYLNMFYSLTVIFLLFMFSTSLMSNNIK